MTEPEALLPGMFIEVDDMLVVMPGSDLLVVASSATRPDDGCRLAVLGLRDRGRAGGGMEMLARSVMPLVGSASTFVPLREAGVALESWCAAERAESLEVERDSEASALASMSGDRERDSLDLCLGKRHGKDKCTRQEPPKTKAEKYEKQDWTSSSRVSRRHAPS